jgi:ABC-type uncharacterized transport system permease subunit
VSRALQALGVLLPAAWVSVSVLYGMHFGGELAPRSVALRRVLLALALALHAALLAVRALATGAFPVFDAWSTVSAVALGLALLHVAVSSRLPTVGSGAMIFGVVAALQLAASALGPFLPAEAVGWPGGYYVFHGVASVLAASALLLSGIHGALYLLLFRSMRQRHFGPLVQRLPSLATLATLTRRGALVGFVLLTVGVNVGIAWAHYGEVSQGQGVSGFEYSDPWVVAVLVLWLHFGAVAFSRRIPGFSAQRASFAAAAGLTVFVAASLLTLSATFHWRS